MEPRYLTVDLLIESESDLTEFTEYLEGKVLFLYKEIIKTLSCIGIVINHINISGPDDNILEILNLIETMPHHLQTMWVNSRKKVIDIGYECGNTMNTIDSFISVNTVQRIAHSGCAINIRIYPYVERPTNQENIIVVNENILDQE